MPIYSASSIYSHLLNEETQLSEMCKSDTISESARNELKAAVMKIFTARQLIRAELAHKARIPAKG